MNFDKLVSIAKICFFVVALFLSCLILFAQEKPLPSIPIAEVGTNPQITTVHTGFKVGNNVGRAKLLKEDWTPTRIEREWIMPLIQNKRWTITEESPRWIEVIVVFEGKLKLTEKRLQKKDYETVIF